MFTVLLRELQVQDSEEQGGDRPCGHVEHGHHEQLHNGGGVTIALVLLDLFVCNVGIMNSYNMEVGSQSS